MEVALARATLQKNAYLPYRDMVVFDRQLDIDSMLPAFKAACSFSGLLAGALLGKQSLMAKPVNVNV